MKTIIFSYTGSVKGLLAELKWFAKENGECIECMGTGKIEVGSYDNLQDKKCPHCNE